MKKTITLEIPGCFETRVSAGIPLSTDELLTIMIEFFRVLRNARDGEQLDDDARFILGAMAWEIARLLKQPAPKAKPVRRAGTNVIELSGRGAP